MNIQQINMPENKSNIPVDDKPIIKFGFGVLIIVFLILGGWMSIAPLATYSVGIGKVSADNEKKSLQHLEGGIVEAIYIKDGDIVVKNQILMKLQDINIKAQLDIYQSQYQDLLALNARYIAHRDKTSDIAFPDELNDENIKMTQINIFSVTEKFLKDEKLIYGTRITQLQNQINGLNSLLLSKKKRLSSLEEEHKEWNELFKEKLVDKLRIREIEREINIIEGELSNTSSEIAKLKEQIEELKMQQLLKEEEFRKDVMSKIVEAQSQIFDLESKILATKNTLNRTEIVSPIDGTVVGLSMHTLGGVIAPGAKILDIIPNYTKPLLIVAQIPISDIDKVQTGLYCDIRFSAFNVQKTHVIEGSVIHVSADSFLDESTGAYYYEVKIVPTEKGMEQISEYKFNLISGMPAEVMIKTGERTLLSYLLKPFLDMFSRGFNEE